MATVDANKITLGAPDQSTTGAVLSAPTGTSLPTTAVEALNTAFVSSGFVTEDGVSLEFNQTKTELRDWSGKSQRTIIENTDGTVSYSLMELSYEGLCQVFGESAVTKTAANAQHGEQLRVSVTGDLPEARAWVFNMKDGDKRTRLVIPNGQVSTLPNITFTAGDAIAIPVEISCHPDPTTGVVVDFMNDDGQKTA